MLQYSEYINNKSLFEIIRRACNCVDARLMDHGFRVSCIVSRIMMKLDENDKVKVRNVCLLAMLHDVGAYKTEEISKMVQFETQNVWGHSIYGYLFIKYFTPLHDLAEAILYHHAPWEYLEKENNISEEIKNLAQIIYIADRIDIYMGEKFSTLEGCVKKIEEERGRRFAPWLVDIVTSSDFLESIEAGIDCDEVYNSIMWGESLTQDEVTEYLKMLIYTIDFRSRHTVTHTITTTSIGYEIAKRMNLSEEYCNKIVCGAMLHDIGKIGVPVEILEYPGKLSPQAMNVMREHVHLGAEIFGGQIDDTVQKIALRHHEKIDGSGYPEGLEGKDLSVGERIVAIADIVSALAGTRSYKKAYSKDQIVKIVNNMKKEKKIDADITDVMLHNYDEIMETTKVRCQPALDKYQNVQEKYGQLSQWSEEYEKQQDRLRRSV